MRMVSIKRVSFLGLALSVLCCSSFAFAMAHFPPGLYYIPAKEVPAFLSECHQIEQGAEIVFLAEETTCSAVAAETCAAAGGLTVAGVCGASCACVAVAGVAGYAGACISEESGFADWLGKKLAPYWPRCLM